MNLHDIAVKHGTDKANHGYCEVYERRLEDRRSEPLKVLEIGVFFGASLRMWREYFPNAEIHGVDLDIKRCGDIDGVTLHKIDANDTNELVKLSEKHGPWDLIVDDGSHMMKHQQSTFSKLWSHVKPDGFYVVEDIHTSFLPKLESCSADAHNEKLVHTTFRMIESLKYEKDFHSKYVSRHVFETLRQDVKHVTIWVRLPKEHSYDYTSDNSMTSMIRKKKT